MPLRSRAASAATLLVLLLCACRAGEIGADSVPDGEPVAKVNGRIVTQADLDDWIRDDLFRRETQGKNPGQLFDLRARALDQLIDEHVLRSESERRKLSLDELITQELEALGPVDDADVEAFFEEHKAQLAGITLEQLAPRIREHLDTERERRVLAALRDQAEVVVNLEPPRFEVAPEGPSRGPADARVTIVEFCEFQCPFCKRALPTIEEVIARYPGEVRIVYRHMPLASVHRRARPAAEASECAHDQQKFWPYHDLLFENPKSLEDDDLLRYAGEVGLDVERFEKCLTEREFRKKVETDVTAASEVGITGTPTFFVNGIMIPGAKPAEAFFDVIDAELTGTEETERS